MYEQLVYIICSCTYLVFPGLVNVLASEDLTLLQQHHGSPLGLVDGIDKATRLDAEPSTLPVRRGPIDLWDVDVFARIELEGGLRTVYLEMNPGARVAELRKLAQGQTARVERDLGRVGLHDEDVVDMRLRGMEHKGLGDVAREFGDGALWDPRCVEGQVVCRTELSSRTSDGGAVTDVEVTIAPSMSMVTETVFVVCSEGGTYGW